MSVSQSLSRSLSPSLSQSRSQSPGQSHPRDEFTALRFSVLLPVPLSSSTSTSSSDDKDNNNDNSDDDDDDDFDIDADTAEGDNVGSDGYGDGDGNGYLENFSRSPTPEPRAALHHRRQRTSIQSLELCFHADFLAHAAHRSHEPLSLHLESRSSPVVLSSTPKSLPTPTPPYYIHEIPNVIDLVTEPTSTPTRGCFVDALKLLLCCFATLGFFSVGSYIARSSAAPSAPKVVAPPQASQQQYTFTFSNHSEPISLYRKILPLQNHRLSLYPLLSDALDHVQSLDDLDSAIHDICHHVAVYLTLPDYSELHFSQHDLDLYLVCQHLSRRSNHVAPNLLKLLASSDYEVIPGKMAHTASLLNFSHLAAEEFVDVFRAGFFDAESDPFIAACRLCDAPDHLSTPDSSFSTPDDDDDDFANMYANPVSTPTQSWHFACSNEFSRLFPPIPNATSNKNYDNRADSIASFLMDWAAVQSARRFQTFYDAPMDLDDTPMYPDNQHPFNESDEVVMTRLPDEVPVFALTRHLVELDAAITDLIRLLTNKGVVSPPSSIPPHSRTDSENEPKFENKQVQTKETQWSSSFSRRDGVFQRLPFPSWLSRSKPSKTEVFRSEEAVSITTGINRLTKIRNDIIIPSIRLLGMVAAGMSHGCLLSADLFGNLAELDRVGAAGWETTVASAKFTNVSASPRTTTTIDIIRTVHTPDVAVEVAALSEASREAMKLTTAWAAARRTEAMQDKASRQKRLDERMQAYKERKQNEPRDEQEAAFLRGLRESLAASGLGDLVDMFRGSPNPQDEHNAVQREREQHGIGG